MKTLAIAFVIGSSLTVLSRAPQAADHCDSIELFDQTRSLLSDRPSDGFVKDWIIAGPIPWETSQGDLDDRANRALDQNFLGRSATGRDFTPVPGETLEGSSVDWKRYSSQENTIDLKRILSGARKDSVVAYAYTEILAQKAQDIFICLGTDDHAEVTLNGKSIYQHRGRRGVLQDLDRVSVRLRKGKNRVLVKVVNVVGGWGFSFRLLTPATRLLLSLEPPRPGLARVLSDAGSILKVYTDTSPLADLLVHADTMRISVRAAGGKVMFTGAVSRGDSVSIRTDDWNDGPYDVFVSNRKDGAKFFCEKLLWFKGDPLQAVQRVLREMDGLTDLGDNADTLRMLLVRKMILARMEKYPLRKHNKLRENPGFAKNMHPLLMEFAEIKSKSDRSMGFHRLAWRDSVDSSPQYCGAFLPEEYDTADALPMVVILHGYSPQNTPYFRGYDAMRRFELNGVRHGMIVIRPHGRGNTGFRGIGEADVIRAVTKACEELKVDESRIYLMGYSMGGAGTWHVGSRHTETFAAIAPIYGGWDYHVWADPNDACDWSERTLSMFESQSSFLQAEALHSTPVLVNHGVRDKLVDINNSRYAVKLLQRWGYNVRYWEHPTKGHENLGNESEVFEWFKQYALIDTPSVVRIRSAHLRDAHAHWIEVIRCSEPEKFIRLVAHIPRKGIIVVKSENAEKIRLTPPVGSIYSDSTYQVVWNDVVFNDCRVGSSGEVISFGHENQTTVMKSPEVEGPLNHVTSTPFVFVYGTASDDPLMNAVCRLRAETERDRWRSWQNVEPRFVADTALTDEQLRALSLCLFGGPEENTVTRQIIGSTPLRIRKSGISIGSETVGSERAATAMVYPNPFNAGRYVRIWAAVSPEAMYTTHLLSDRYDYVVADGLEPAGDSMHDAEDLYAAYGFFDNEWKFEEKHSFDGERELRERATRHISPKLLSVERDCVWVDELLESKAEGSFAFIRRYREQSGVPMTFDTVSYGRGISTEVWHEPAAITFSIGESSNYQRLSGVLGIRISEEGKPLTKEEQKRTGAVFRVFSGERQLYESPVLNHKEGPLEFEVNISNSEEITLVVETASIWFNRVKEVYCANLVITR